jgi:hypothetical protein
MIRRKFLLETGSKASVVLASCILATACAEPIDRDDLTSSTEQDIIAWRADQNGSALPGVGSWGGWQLDSSLCPAGMWAVGYQMRVEGSQGGGLSGGNDDTSLNSVNLLCQNLTTGAQQWIGSHPGVWGSWYPGSTCSGSNNLLKGARMRIEAPQGGDDDTAANDVEFACTKIGRPHAPGGNPWGTWGSFASCPANTAVCGLNIRFEESVGGDDDTAMNGLELECCNLPCNGTCGDGQCGLCENAQSCVQDCGYCGDGVCYNESSSSCVQDCGYCGDGTCYNESSYSCTEDCGPPPSCLIEPCQIE